LKKKKKRKKTQQKHSHIQFHAKYDIAQILGLSWR
jgi:hypothetical protein